MVRDQGERQAGGLFQADICCFYLGGPADPMDFPVLESVVMKAVLGEFPCWEHAGWVTAHGGVGRS